LGNSRLSIIDLSTAADRAANAAGTVALVFNGEIYNHAEISDAGPGSRPLQSANGPFAYRGALRPYEEWAAGLLQHAYGMFAVAIYASSPVPIAVVHLIRDESASADVWHEGRPRRMVCASEIRALLATSHVRPERDRTAFWHYLHRHRHAAPLTMFAAS